MLWLAKRKLRWSSEEKVYAKVNLKNSRWRRKSFRKKVNWELIERAQPICWTLSSLVVASYIWPGPGMKIMCFGSTSEKRDYFISSSRLGQILKDWLSRKERRVIWHFGSPAEPCIHQPVIFQFTNFWAHHVAQDKRLSPKKIHKSLSPSKMIIFLT